MRGPFPTRGGRVGRSGFVRSVLGLALLALGGCSVGTSEPFVRRTLGFSFETTLDPWEPDGTDLDDPPIEWSIEQTDELANEGEGSARFSLENLNDAGKIWLETAVGNLTPGVSYRVTLAFDFATADGNVNAWRIIAGASAVNPEAESDLAFQGSTGSGAGPGAFVWQREEYTFEVTPGADRRIWLSIGVWGTSEFARTYYVDGVDVEIVRGG